MTSTSILYSKEFRKHVENMVRDDDFQELLDDMFDALESDDIEYVKGMLCAQHNDYFKVLAENYCYKKGQLIGKLGTGLQKIGDGVAYF